MIPLTTGFETVSRRQWVLIRLAAFFLGAVAALGQAPWSLWWLSLLGFSAVFYLLKQTERPQRAAWIGWCFGTGYFALALFWIVEPFLVDIARHGWMAPFALILMAGGLALFWMAAFVSAHRYGGASKLALGIVLLTLAEVLRGLVFTGFPWATIGHIWTDHSMLQLAAIGGAPLLTLLTLVLAGLPWMVPKHWIGGLVALVLLAIGWVYGGWTLSNTTLPTPEKQVRVIQPNAAQHLKWKPEHIPVFFERQLAMTAEPSETPLDLIIWPETAIAYRLGDAPLATATISEAAKGVPVIFGANDQVGGNYRNGLAVLDAQGQVADLYYKHHLVPFGEYIPFGELLADFGIHGLAARDGAGYESGPGQKLIDIPGIGRALPLICYELIFPRHFRKTERPDVLIQITNDAWFGNISGPYQHLAQARLRAVEQGLPMVRSANTGVSAMIDPLGRIVGKTPLNEAGYLDRPLPKALPPTVYSRFGDWPVYGLLTVLLIGLFAARKPNGD